MGLFSNRSNRIAAAEASEHIMAHRNKALDILGAGKKDSLAALDRNFDSARGSYQGAIDLFSPYAKTGGSAFNLYADALGVNGQAAADAARSSFRESPGYQYMVDQATDQTARKMSALGALGSGNTIAAVQDRAANLADQEWGDWLSGLNGLGQIGYNATGNQASLTKGIGDLYAQQGGLDAGIRSSMAGLGASTVTNAGNSLANLRMQALGNGNPRAAGLNLGLGLLGSGLSFLGTGTGGGNTIGGSLFNSWFN